MKRRIVLLLVGLMVLTGCGSEVSFTSIAPSGQDTPRVPVVEVGGQLVAVDEDLEKNELTAEDFAIDPETGRMLCTSRTTVTGIDVSAHQEEIDWAAVAGDGIDFAMLRIGSRGYSQGGLKRDGFFELNYTRAREQGLDLGVYFFSQAISVEEAVEEAQFVLDLLEGRELELPVVFDWEEIGSEPARTDDVDVETVTACALAFCDVIARAGYTPAIYCNGMVGYLRYDFAEIEHLPLWYADYAGWPGFAYALEMWQYTSSGTVAGVEGKVDLNLLFIEE